jgi:hypothetical protein
MFVSHHGNELARFRDAMKAGDLEKAVSAIQGLAETGGASLLDGFELLLLLARTRDARFERSAKRWLRKFSEASDRTLAEVQMAGAALGGLCNPDTFKRSELVLRDLLRWIE